MVIHPEKKWLFISTRKAGTNTCYDVLTKIGGTRLHPKYKHPKPGSRMADLHFTTIRNPYSRAVSIWRFMHGRHQKDDFEEFCRDCLGNKKMVNSKVYLNQSVWHDRFIVDKVIKLENLREELETIVGPVGHIPKLNSVFHHHWTTYMTNGALEYINRWAEEDFVRGDYVKYESIDHWRDGAGCLLPE